MSPVARETPNDGKLPKCYDGGRHRWLQRVRAHDMGTEGWCSKCGAWYRDISTRVVR